ncbi:hypothetical protein N0V86_008796 [Didymella sp. IMI 355093]|nr:hypothetical protein N0V86_008796 [Didymella sp. IMI 355093]
MALIISDSPSHDADSARSLYRRDPLTPVPIRLEDFFSSDGRALLKKLEEHPDVQEVRGLPTPEPVAAPAAEFIQQVAPGLPPFIFPAPEPQPPPVNIDELSAGLGLPLARTDNGEDASTVVSHECRVPQAHPGALYGKLIGWALDKPLTAKGLAEFLQKQDTNALSQPPAPPPVSPTKTVVHKKTDTTPTKSSPRSARVEHTPSSRRVAIPAPTETITVLRGSSTQHHQHRRSSSTASFRQHTRMPSHRRYPRRPSRAKRSDQGPMPSAADIYPDDAHFTPTPIHEGHMQSYFPHARQNHPQPQVIANPFNWPPPAQAYAPELPPTSEDVADADTDVLDLISELPALSLCTLAKLGNTHDLRATSAFGLESADLAGDERALTPGQKDGSRYGIRFWGIGYGDQWDVCKTSKVRDLGQSDAFRVRRREHEGWGGMQWALAKGWEY